MEGLMSFKLLLWQPCGMMTVFFQQPHGVSAPHPHSTGHEKKVGHEKNFEPYQIQAEWSSGHMFEYAKTVCSDIFIQEGK